QQVEGLLADFAAVRGVGGHEGWTLRRATEPVVLADALLPALAYCTRAGQRVPLIPAPETPVGVERVASIVTRVPLVALQAGTAGRAEISGIPMLPYISRGESTALPGLLARAGGEGDAGGERDEIETMAAEGGVGGGVAG